MAGAPDGGLDLLLELADSQISYRQRYVMIAALAPVIDLVLLDPNNPRSVDIPARPHRDPSRRVAEAECERPPVAGRSRSPPRSRRACAPSMPAPVDEELIVDIEKSLMKLSDAISVAFLTNNERSESMWEALA